MARKKKTRRNNRSTTKGYQTKSPEQKALKVNALSNMYRDGGGRPLEFFRQFSGYPIETKRNIICQYGYPASPGFAEFYAVGKRVGLGKAVVNLPVNKCWQTLPKILDVTEFDDEGEPVKFADSDFVREMTNLINDRGLQLWERIKGTDRKQRYGMYSGCLIVTKDSMGRSSREPLDSLVPGQLVKLVPFYEAQLIPIEYDQDIGSANYGDPTMWQLIENAVNPKPGKQLSIEVHPSRLIIAAEGSEDGTIYGTPALESCLYSIMDWEKARMSSSEGIKRNNDQRGVISLDEGANMPHPDSEQAEIMDENISRWDNGDDALLTVANAKVTPFNASFHDPSKTADMILMEVGASVEIPSTILVGYQTGRLASIEDTFNFAQSMMQRREGWCNELIFQFIDRLIEVGLLPDPDGDIVIQWDDLTEPSPRDKLENADKMSIIDERRFKTGRAPAFSDAEYREAAGYAAEMVDGEDEDFAVDVEG